MMAYQVIKGDKMAEENINITITIKRDDAEFNRLIKVINKALKEQK